MGNTVPPRASREATGTGRRGAGTGRRRSENVVVTEAAPPATPSRRVVATARKQGRDDDDGDVEEETTRAGRALRAGGDGDGDGAAPALAGKAVLTVKIVMRRKDAEALVARLKAQSARGERKARMALLKGDLRAGSCGGGGASPAWSRVARRPMLPPIKENRFERITAVV
ncbi:unnamed protein product [Miscanthus lutarioriparius]|uniref:Uncharacterized protein n=1 Tax=Miscanthus lutarioriparius TaxID=422564 RepID=A0A811NSG6_9POAL|nr:unnamed protein product [Miscanthus lutarioriparius]